MKHVALFLFGFFTLICVHAQSYKFNGDWEGKITLTDQSSTLRVRIIISGEDVQQYFYDDEEGGWSPVKPVVSRYYSNKNNFLYYWMNNSSVWSETQTYMLSYVNEDKLYVVWARQVNNVKNEEDNDTWSLQGSGYLTQNN